GHATCQEEGAGASAEPAEAWRMHARLHHDAEEAELSIAQSCEGAAYQRLRGDRLYPRRGAQSAGALGGDDPRRARKGPARRSLPHPARCARHARREKSQAKALQIWSKTTQVIGSFCIDARPSEVQPSEAGNPARGTGYSGKVE